MNIKELALVLAFALVGNALANDSSPTDGAKPPSQWTPYARGGYVHQFDTDLNGGGQFDVDRVFVQGGVSYSFGPRRRIAFAIGAGRDRYDFSGNPGFVNQPWDHVNQLRFSAPVTWAFDDQWTLFAIPTLRFYGESGADSGDSATGGALGGASYRVNDRLTIGPGIGVFSQLEDNVNVFPILIVDWKITVHTAGRIHNPHQSNTSNSRRQTDEIPPSRHCHIDPGRLRFHHTTGIPRRGASRRNPRS